jgi:hypothetical protein
MLPVANSSRARTSAAFTRARADWMTLPGGSQPQVLGQVLTALEPDAPPVEGGQGGVKNKVAQNAPMMPVARLKTYSIDGGPTGRVFTTTLGALTGLEAAGVRRLLVNACNCAVGLEDAISASSDGGIVGEFQPTMYGFRKDKTAGIAPTDRR